MSERRPLVRGQRVLALFLAFVWPAAIADYLWALNQNHWMLPGGLLAHGRLLASALMFQAPLWAVAAFLLTRLKGILRDAPRGTLAAFIVSIFFVDGIILHAAWERGRWPRIPFIGAKDERPVTLLHHPNGLLLTLDTLRPDRLGCYGNPDAYTPVLDRLAREGVMVADAHTAIPRTGPAHASMLSGLYPRSHGTRVNGVPLAEDVPMMQEFLAAQGYQTEGIVSGWTLNADQSGIERGFARYDDKFSPDFLLIDEAVSLASVKLWTRLGVLDVRFWDTVERRAGETSRRAIAAINRLYRGSFFLMIHYFDPHTPYFPHPEIDGLFPSTPRFETTHRGVEMDVNREIALHNGEVAYMDAKLGALLRGMQQRRSLRNLVLIATADHGESLTEHNYYFEHGDNLFRQSVEIPFIVRYPGRVPSNVVYEGPMNNAEIAPTMLELMGFPKALANTADSQAEAFRQFQPLPPRPMFSETIEDPHNVERPGGWPWQSVQRDKWKFMTRKSQPPRLHDITNDPEEAVNLLYDDPAMAEALHKLLRTWNEGAAEAGAIDIDPASKERLKALGYVD